MSKPVPRTPAWCQWCGKEFLTHLCNIKKGGGKYCCHRCFSDSRIGERHVPRAKVNCATCSKQFEVTQFQIDYGQGKFCSRKCLTESQRTGVIKDCLTCGKQFFAYQSAIKRGGGIYCSKECSYLDRKTPLPNCICKNCGKEFYMKPFAIKRNRGVFCSRACLAAKVEVTCLCGNVFFTKQNIINNGKGKYCSRKCRKLNSKMIEIIRPTCQKPFMEYPSNIAHGMGVYCSVECYRRGSVPTRIENICYQELVELGLIEGEDFIFQYRYPKTKFIIDFFLPSLNLAIEANGDYWHRIPSGMERDKRKRERMEDDGVILITWWEHEIKANIANLIQRDLLPLLYT